MLKKSVTLSIISLGFHCASLHAVSLAGVSAKYRLDTLSFAGSSGTQKLTSKLSLEAGQDTTFFLTTSRLFSLRTHLAARYFEFNAPDGYLLRGRGMGLTAALGFRWGGDSVAWNVLFGAEKAYVAEESAGQIGWRTMWSPGVYSSVQLGIYRAVSFRVYLSGGGGLTLPAAVGADRSMIGLSGFSELSVDLLPSLVPLRLFTRAEIGDHGWNRNQYQSIQFGIEFQLGITAAPLR